LSIFPASRQLGVVTVVLKSRVQFSNEMSTRCPIGHLSETSDSHGYQFTEAMTTLGGGSVAAYGLKYQYLSTVEYLLRYLRGHPELIARTTLVVEPLVKSANDADDDAAVHHIQVKAT
jgi:hypothetical protein